MDFSAALIALKNGQKVCRSGWNGKGMFLFLVPGSTFLVNRPPLLGIYPEGTEIKYHAHVDMRTAQGDIVPWLCSQTDLLADDWMPVVEEEKPVSSVVWVAAVENMPGFYIPDGYVHGASQPVSQPSLARAFITRQDAEIWCNLNERNIRCTPQVITR